MTPRESALAYARLGWRVFPVAAGEKRPLDRGWQRDATTDPDLIAQVIELPAGRYRSRAVAE
jgi:Bifunctional DNA primase/polymerase, N-terminal